MGNCASGPGDVDSKTPSGCKATAATELKVDARVRSDKVCLH